MVKWAVYVFLLTLAHFSKADDLSQFLDAAAFGDEETLSALLEKGSVTVNQRNAFGESALHLASIKPKLEIVQFLLKAGADPSAFTEGSYQGSAESFKRQAAAQQAVPARPPPAQATPPSSGEACSCGSSGTAATRSASAPCSRRGPTSASSTRRARPPSTSPSRPSAPTGCRPRPAASDAHVPAREGPLC